MEHEPGALLKEARRRVNLSQRALARRAGTSQSVVARIELGITDPSSGTLASLLAAAGFELRSRLERSITLDPDALDDTKRILRLAPEDRLREVANVSSFHAAASRL